MNPVLAMTRELDVQLWVGLMEIKGHFVSQNVIAFLVPWIIRCVILWETLACQIF